MRQLPERIQRKKAIWQRYAEQLAGVPGVQLFDHDLTLCTPWFIDGRFARRDDLAAHLKREGIGSRTMYPPIHQQKAYDRPGSFPVSEAIGREGLWLPSMIQLSDAQIDRVCTAIRAFYA